MLSIIVPVYNEEKTISVIIDKLKKLDLEKEIIVVDDCSSDNSYEILKKTKGISLFKHEINKGKGAAIKTGIANSKGDILTIQDADLEYNPEDFKFLIKPILENKTKVVYGSRFLNKNFNSFQREKTIISSHYIGNKFLTFLTTILYRQKLTDMETCYKVFKREVIKDIRIKSNRFEFEPEITAKILKGSYRIIEIPINYHPRSFDEGKKITWKDGIKAIFYLIKYRFLD